jgi:hypothetical protein
MAGERALLVAFGDWLYPRIGLEVWHREIDAFLATLQPPGERDVSVGEPCAPPLVLGCEHGRAVGHPCPHCMGINEPDAACAALAKLEAK